MSKHCNNIMLLVTVCQSHSQSIVTQRYKVQLVYQRKLNVAFISCSVFNLIMFLNYPKPKIFQIRASSLVYC